MPLQIRITITINREDLRYIITNAILTIKQKKGKKGIYITKLERVCIEEYVDCAFGGTNENQI
jgi:hypothetical protein